MITQASHVSWHMPPRGQVFLVLVRQDDSMSHREDGMDIGTSHKLNEGIQAIGQSEYKSGVQVNPRDLQQLVIEYRDFFIEDENPRLPLDRGE